MIHKPAPPGPASTAAPDGKATSARASAALVSYARRTALACAAIGVVLAAALFAALAGFERVALSIWLGTYGGRFALGMGVLFAAGALAGPRVLAAGVHGGRLGAAIRGAAFGIACLLAAIAVPAAASLLIEPRVFAFGVGVAIFDWVIKPVYWVALFGGAPAALLGMTAVVLVRRRARRSP